MDSDTKPLIEGASKQTPAVVGSAPSSARAYKVAGFTVLACLLVAAQGLVVYMMLRQGNDITGLEQRADKLNQRLLSRPQPAAAAEPVRMHMPVNMMPMLVDFNEEEGSAETASEGLDSLSECQMESLGVKRAKQRWALFRPQCDDQGNYLPRQCWFGGQRCWCVDAGGREVRGTVTRGAGRTCTASAAAVPMRMNVPINMMPRLLDVDE